MDGRRKENGSSRVGGLRRSFRWLQDKGNLAVAGFTLLCLTSLASGAWTFWEFLNRPPPDRVREQDFRDFVTAMLMRAPHGEIDAGFVRQVESLVVTGKYDEAAQKLRDFPRHACSFFIRANIEWLRNPTVEPKRRIELLKADAKVRFDGNVVGSWGRGEAVLNNGGTFLQADMKVAFSNTPPGGKADDQTVRLHDDGKMEIILGSHGDYPFQLLDHSCINRDFFIGRMEEVNGTSRAIIVLKRIEATAQAAR